MDLLSEYILCWLCHQQPVFVVKYCGRFLILSYTFLEQYQKRKRLQLLQLLQRFNLHHRQQKVRQRRQPDRVPILPLQLQLPLQNPQLQPQSLVLIPLQSRLQTQLRNPALHPAPIPVAQPGLLHCIRRRQIRSHFIWELMEIRVIER